MAARYAVANRHSTTLAASSMPGGYSGSCLDEALVCKLQR